MHPLTTGRSEPAKARTARSQGYVRRPCLQFFALALQLPLLDYIAAATGRRFVAFAPERGPHRVFCNGVGQGRVYAYGKFSTDRVSLNFNYVFLASDRGADEPVSHHLEVTANSIPADGD